MDIKRLWSTVALLLLTSSAFFPAISFAEETRSYIVQFKDSYRGKTESAKALLSDAILSTTRKGLTNDHIKFKKTFDALISATIVDLSEEEVDRLRMLNFVEHVEEDRINAPDMGWGLDRINQQYLPLDNNFYRPYQGAGEHIYILDTGINASHQEFIGRVGTVTSLVGGSGADCQGHGTHVASIAAGATVGAASDATIHSVRISADCVSGDAMSSDMLDALNWVLVNGQPGSVINLSYASSSTAVASAMYNLIANDGHVLVTTAGNDNVNACTSPSVIKPPLALIVGATVPTDQRASSSNYGACNDLFAPGSSIRGANYSSNTGYIYMSGTSMASPFVAGIAAIYKQRFPGASVHEVMEAIIDGATVGVVSDPVGSPNRLAYTDIDQPSAFWRRTGFIPVNSSPSAASVPLPECTAGQIYIQYIHSGTSMRWICQ